MKNLTGVGVSAGRVIGPVLQMPEPIQEPTQGLALAEGETPEAAVERLKAASTVVKENLQERAGRTSGNAASVLKSTALMAGDKALLKNAGKLITGKELAPERAIWEAAGDYATQMKALGGYMAQRVTDILDVRSRIVAELNGQPAPGIPESTEPFILVAEDLAPADTATLDIDKVIALVTSEGGPQAHTAILARDLGLPAIVAANGATEIPNGTLVYVDATDGTVVAPPGEKEKDLAEKYAHRKPLPAFDGRGVLSDGTEVPLYSNVGNGKAAQTAAEGKAEGVGLFRTEFAFLNREEEPSVEEQTVEYKAVFDAFPGRHVVVRTLDAGADKPLPFLTDASEPNPALGVRGYRTDWTSPGVLGRQLEAISAAASESTADVWVMAPMISTAPEAGDFARMLEEAGLRTHGVMIETPSAAVTARSILDEVDFVSLGTNDLTQYTMAADRLLGPLAELNNPWQPAVLRMIELTVQGARESQESTGRTKSVSVCGEAAADPALAVTLVGLGVNALSMNTRSLPAVAAVLKSVTLEEAQRVAAKVMAARSAEDAKEAARAELPILDELGL
ncbi:phosphoenolpyruvate--protein phosphotransferase [Rothia sp. AR01]|uniref:Phosphoenolpyruvate-protein phosphotransferase n=1 Tax=Rothia santali TaxID=2949643 RepID=A0A9X2HDI9_9MICC|nr:phosphoenolpyruvate--protein phosphotransferase [Rothia santali]MCP3426300.1 phosphoenolpyruvate--protein phosphotransferase [Rothia santali]